MNLLKPIEVALLLLIPVLTAGAAKVFGLPVELQTGAFIFGAIGVMFRAIYLVFG